MKLNSDCVRDILLYVEKKSSPNNKVIFSFNDNIEDLSKYSNDEIKSHIEQCKNSGFFSAVSYDITGICYVSDLSTLGHKFLANIRSDTNWNKTKEKLKKIGSSSLNALVEIAIDVASEVISSQF